jgi:hypothetical protein
MIKCSTSLSVEAIQIKTALRFCLTPLEWLSSTTQTTTNVGEDAEIKEPLYASGGIVN